MGSSWKQDWIVAGIPTRLITAGQGLGVVFLHGTGGSGRVWFNQIRRLESAYRVIAPDLPGYGQTFLPDSIQSIDDYPAFVLALLDEAGLSKAVLVGTSMGGRVALQVALDHPDRVSGLVLIDSSGLKIPGIPTLDVRETDPRTFASKLFFQPVTPSERAFDSPEQRQARQTMLRLTAPTLRQDMQGRLGEIGVPTLVIWGEGDQIIPPAYGEALASAIPGAQLALIPRAGHVPMLERPGAVNEVLDSFLSKVAGAVR